jgi:hypothetical protein
MEGAMGKLATKLGAFALCAVSCISAPYAFGNDETDRQTVRDVFMKLALDDRKLDALATTNFPMFQGDHHAIVVRHYQRMLRNPKLADAIYDAAYPLVKSGAKVDFAAFGAAYGIKLATKGFARLPTEKQETFLEYSREMMVWLNGSSPEACKRMVVGGDTMGARDSQKIEMAFLAERPPHYMQAVMDLYYESMTAELNDSPPPRTLTVEEKDYSDKLVMASFTELLETPGSEKYAAALSDAASADPSDLCKGGIMYIDAILKLKGPAKDWGVLAFILSMG